MDVLVLLPLDLAAVREAEHGGFEFSDDDYPQRQEVELSDFFIPDIFDDADG